MQNPFLNWIVGNPWEHAEADVSEIGKSPFDVCCRAIEDTFKLGRSSGVLVHGEPGSGKTHLIRRVRTYLANHTDRRFRRVPFVYIRLSTTASMIWRHLRRRLADDLVRVTNGMMQIEQMLYRVLACPGSRGDLLDQCKRDWAREFPLDQEAFAHALSVMLRRLPENYLATLTVFDSLDGQQSLPPGLLQAFRHLVSRRNLGLVHAWLRGDSLTSADLNKLGVPEDTTQEEQPEYLAREMVLSLVRFAGTKIPMILCFDQIEALETKQGDRSGFAAFGDAVSTLHDETTNLVLLSCLQTSVLGLKVFRDADFARIAERQAHLSLINQRDARRLIQARQAAVQTNSEWQPTAAELEPVFNQQGEATARAVLARAAELFGQPPPLESTKSFLQMEWERRMNSAASSISEGDIDEVTGQGFQELIGIVDGSWSASDGERDVDIRLRSTGRNIAVSLCNQKSMTSLAARLRRLSAPGSVPADTRLIILRDQRLPISKGARATRNYLDGLVESGAALVHPSFEALLALETLRTLLAEARSGDLTHGAVPVRAETVQDWIRQHMPSCLEDLMNSVTGNSTVTVQNTRLREDLLALLEKRYVLPLQDAAAELDQEVSSLSEFARKESDFVGFLEGPQPVLYLIVPASTD